MLATLFETLLLELEIDLIVFCLVMSTCRNKYGISILQAVLKSARERERNNNRKGGASEDGCEDAKSGK